MLFFVIFFVIVNRQCRFPYCSQHRETSCFVVYILIPKKWTDTSFKLVTPSKKIKKVLYTYMQMLNRGPQSSIFSPTGLISKLSIRGLEAPSAGCWLSRPHLITNGSSLQTNWLPVFTELYNSSTPTFLLWASQIALIKPIHGRGYNILIDRMHLLFT